MQEQPPYKITPEQGWARMAHILEREMPVTKRPRRIIIFWWTAAAVLTAGLVMLFALVNNNSSVSPLVTDKYITPQHNELPPAAKNESTEHGTDASQSISGAVSKGSSAPDEITSHNYTRGQLRDHGSLSINIPEPVSINRVTLQDENQKSSEVLPIAVESLSQSTGNEILTVDITNTSDRVAEPVKPISSLAVLTALPLSSPETDLSLLHKGIEPVVKKKKLIEPYVAARVMDGYLGGLGVHGGVGADINVKSRLSINVGAGYNLFSPSVSFLGTDKELTSNADAFDLLREDLGYNGIGSYLPADELNSSAGNVITPFINIVRQWQATLGLKYKLSRRLSVEGGAAYTFGTTSSSAYPIVEQDYSNPTTGFRVTNSFDGYEVLKSNTALVYAGLGYKLSPRFELSAQWNHALEPYLINTPAAEFSKGDRSDYIKGLNLGLRYFL